MQVLVRRRFGLRRFPVATVVVFAVTATTSLLQAVVPGCWRRCNGPGGAAGRLVADPHVPVRALGGGVRARRSADRALLAGTGVPRLAPMVVLWWCGALLSLHWGAVPLVVCVVGAAVVQLVPGWTVVAGRVVAVVAAGSAVALAAVRDIHGAAMLAGIAIAAVLR